ncbi:MAG TPA: ADP-ribosylglycohydrolase family protein, partial [Candidatus Glassbacteria bacterium]|nr:ADP-ribosylglycohydrolase family protein [Candidatus Glassbacteria bacterium]
MTFNRLSLVTLLCAALAAGRPGNLGADTLTLSDSVVRDKIKGGWVGQVVGCTFGGPTEFRWLGTWIQDYTPIRWDENLMLEYFENGPGLYDDIYMDLSFMSVLADKGLGAPLELLAKKYADAGFQLWHANQAGRWNILHGVMPPASGHWQNNPHADDIDFQIESDFIGLICPGMPQSALELADKVGHIMNYGDGVYGGYYVSAMYTQAFVEKDIVTVVEKALASLPAASRYHRCISDVLAAWRAHPEDWRECWFEVQKNYADDVGCPHGALNPFNIDAVINGAYITIGLLYGGGDFGKTLEIATRCGQDSDCNPSNAGGVLGALLGFEAIPERWKLGLDKVENLKFSYSDYSLTDIYAVNHRLAAEMVKRGGGAVTDSAWTIQTQQAQTPQSVEVAFEGLKPVAKDGLREVRLDKNPYSATFSGRGFVIDGNLEENRGRARCEVRVDGKLTETVVLEGDSHNRRTPLFWNYGLAD